MHYYQFSIGDYARDTQHLDHIEDIIYRRMIDYYYLNESPLPGDVKDIARLIRMRSECERIADVLREFFELTDDGWKHKRIEQDIRRYREKSEKAKKSAQARWENKSCERIANAKQTQSEGNANHKPITNNQEPVSNTPQPPKGENRQRKNFAPPSIEEVMRYCYERGNNVDPERWHNHYTSNGWKVGRNPMKDWKAAIRTWEKNADERQQTDSRSRAKRFSDRLDEIARESLQREAEAGRTLDGGDIQTDAG